VKEWNNFRIGCSGYSYRDWRGVFYPESLSQSDLINHYEKYFDVVELNFSFYVMPQRDKIERILEKSRRLNFSIKAPSIFTHERNYDSSHVKEFLSSIKPLTDSGRFIAILFQFPQSFHLSHASLDYLRKLSENFSGIRRVAELRSRTFLRIEALMEMEFMGFSVVNTDAPKVRGLFIGPWKKTGELNYVRLHGRRADRWHGSEKSFERYDYLYSDAELKQIRETLVRAFNGEETYVFFNNHYRAKAVLNALKLKEMFGKGVKIPSSLRGAHSSRLWE